MTPKLHPNTTAKWSRRKWLTFPYHILVLVIDYPDKKGYRPRNHIAVPLWTLRSVPIQHIKRALKFRGIPLIYTMTDKEWPWLPPELVERIIGEAWILPLSPKERTTLVNSSYLVNHIWQSLFAKIASKDVHIASLSHVERLFKILSRENWVHSNPHYKHSNLDLVCTSLTFTVDAAVYPVRSPRPMTSKMDLAICDTLHTVTSFNYLPNLRRLSILHAHWNESEAFDQFRFTTFPPQVTELELAFSGPGGVVPVSVMLPSSKHLQWGSFASVSKVIVSGASEDFVRTIVEVCPNVKTLQIDGTPKLPTVVPLPASVQKLIIKNPDTSEERIQGLINAMLKGLIVKSHVTPEVILEWGEPDSITRARLEAIARDCGLLMSHRTCTF